MTIDVQKIISALQAGKSDQAKSLLDDYFSQDISPDDKAAAHVLLAKVYMTAMNDLQLDYKNKLEKAIRLLERTAATEENMSSQLQIKEEISQL